MLSISIRFFGWKQTQGEGKGKGGAMEGAGDEGRMHVGRRHGRRKGEEPSSYQAPRVTQNKRAAAAAVLGDGAKKGEEGRR